MARTLNRIWQGLRRVSGEDAYERYLLHWQSQHVGDGRPPLDRKAFYRQYLENKWNGVKRCC